MLIEVRPLSLPEVKEIIPPRFADARGFFSESWSAAAFEQAGLALDFVQDNESHSLERGVLRGLHYQTQPYSQDKLVRVVQGAVFDVAVDIRQGSPTFRQWTGVTLSAEKGNQLLVPKGFAHGFLTLEPRTTFLYKVTAPYARGHDRAIRFDDPEIGIDWPVASDALVLSDKDRAAPLLRDAELL